MDIRLSDRVRAIKPSPTIAVTARAAEPKAAGRDIIALGAGEPDFDTPEHIKQAARDAIDRGFTKYTNVDGTPGLKAAVCAKLARDNLLAYEPAQVVVSCGAKHSIYNLLQALINPGDEVIVPAPYWVSYPDMAILAGGVPVVIEAGIENAFKITPEQLDAAITPKTRLLMLNSPSNPTGVCYTRADLEALGEVLRRHPQVVICTDDIYELIAWGDEPFCNIATACPDLQERTVVVNGVSKAYAMTGWRIGYAAGPVELIKAMGMIQSQSTTNPSSISQTAAVTALDGTQDFIPEWAAAFQKRRDLVVGMLNQASGITCRTPEGAFYVYPNCSGTLGRKTPEGKVLQSDDDFAAYLLAAEKVVVVPGSAFGLSPHFRISYATSEKVLEEACLRIQRACGALR